MTRVGVFIERPLKPLPNRDSRLLSHAQELSKAGHNVSEAHGRCSAL